MSVLQSIGNVLKRIFKAIFIRKKDCCKEFIRSARQYHVSAYRDHDH
jgi:hypothetical protein